RLPGAIPGAGAVGDSRLCCFVRACDKREALRNERLNETTHRAWRNFASFEGRASLRTWLYRIASNVCLDMLDGAQRRARPMDLRSPAPRAPPLADVLLEATGILPIPDGRVLLDRGAPAELVSARETIRLAFIAALQFLPPRQRAVLILCEVLDWKASE